MKLILLALGFVAIATASRVNLNRQKDVLSPKIQNRAFETELRALMEKFRAIMSVGSENLGIPIMDPLTLETFKVDLSIPELADLKIDLTDLLLDGLKEFIIRDISFTVLKMRLDFKVTIPLLKGKAANYILNGVVLDGFNIFGEGKGEFELENLEADTYGTVILRNGHLFMNKFEANLRISKVKSNLEGLQGGGAEGDLVNEMIEELLPVLVVEEKEKLSAFIGNIAMDFANGFLTEMTLQDFIDFINGVTKP